MCNLKEGSLSAHLHIEVSGSQHGANFDNSENDHKLIDGGHFKKGFAYEYHPERD